MRTTICLPASLSHPCLPRLSWANSQLFGINPFCPVPRAQCRLGGVTLPPHLAQLPSFVARKPLILQDAAEASQTLILKYQFGSFL